MTRAMNIFNCAGFCQKLLDIVQDCCRLSNYCFDKLHVMAAWPDMLCLLQIQLPADTAALKAQVQELMRDNGILKRAVQIQAARMQVSIRSSLMGTAVVHGCLLMPPVLAHGPGNTDQMERQARLMCTILGKVSLSIYIIKKHLAAGRKMHKPCILWIKDQSPKFCLECS